MDADQIFIALTNPVSGKEDEFNDFYDRVHVPDVLGAPGWIAAQRYVLSSEQRSDQSPPYRYLVIYEIARPDGQVLSALHQREDLGPGSRPDPPLWEEDNQVWLYRKIGSRQVRG